MLLTAGVVLVQHTPTAGPRRSASRGEYTAGAPPPRRPARFAPHSSRARGPFPSPAPPPAAPAPVSARGAVRPGPVHLLRPRRGVSGARHEGPRQHQHPGESFLSRKPFISSLLTRFPLLSRTRRPLRKDTIDILPAMHILPGVQHPAGHLRRGVRVRRDAPHGRAPAPRRALPGEASLGPPTDSPPRALCAVLCVSRGDTGGRASARAALGSAHPAASALPAPTQGYTVLVWWVVFVSAVGGLLVAYVVRIPPPGYPLSHPPLSPNAAASCRRLPAAETSLQPRPSAPQVRHLDSIMKNFAATASIVVSTAVSIPLFGFAVDMDFAVGARGARARARGESWRIQQGGRSGSAGGGGGGCRAVRTAPASGSPIVLQAGGG